MSAPEIASPTWLLVKTCQDLVAKSQSADLYGKLRMAGLVRHLLVGTHALADRSKDDPGDALVFWFREPPDDAAEWSTAEGFDASRRKSARGEVRRTDATGFLASRVAYFGQWYSVGQLLAAIEHFYGGASSSGLEDVSRASMMALDRAVRTTPNVVAVALQEIVGVTLLALKPHADKLQPQGERSAPKPPVAPVASGCPFAGKIPVD